MASFFDIAGKSIRLLLLSLKNFTLNCYRRLIICWKYVGIFMQKRRIGKQFRHLGESVYAKLAAGDVNPLLQEEVRDQLTSLESLQENLASRRDAIHQIREQIRAVSYRLTPAPAPPEPEPKPDRPVD